MDKICITVIIVSYKSAQLTVDAIASVFQEKNKCTNLNVNVVVVDNASGDTPVIAAAVKKEQWSEWVTVLTAPKNGGFSYGNNYGFQYALQQGPVDYFHLLNPDTQMRPGSLKALVDFMESNNKVGIAGSSFETLDGKSWPYAFRFPSLISEFESALQFGPITKLLKNKIVPVVMGDENTPIDWIAGASMLIRCSVVKELRGFDESYFLYYEETDFCLRAKKAGYATWYIPKSRVMHILGQSTKVTEVTDDPKRLPSYWFESRTNYFLKNHGRINTMLIDLLTVLGLGLTTVKRAFKKLLLNKSEKTVPFYTTDLIANSSLLAKNSQKKPFISPL
jgi:GT2 family glycosyltransferase